MKKKTPAQSAGAWILKVFNKFFYKEIFIAIVCKILCMAENLFFRVALISKIFGEEVLLVCCTAYKFIAYIAGEFFLNFVYGSEVKYRT